MRLRKNLLLFAILTSAAFPLLFVPLDQPTPKLNLYIFLAKAGSLSGSILIFWQFLLGFRLVFGKFIRDLLWLLSLHKTIGQYILFLIFFHPIFITLFYLDQKGFNPLLPSENTPFFIYTTLGAIALLLFLIIVTTSLFLKSKLKPTRWYIIHLSSYLALPLIFIHSLAIGMTLHNTPLGLIWKILAALMSAFFIFRLICRLGFLSKKHIVTSVEKVGPNVTKISCSPVKSKIQPKLGQFIYFRIGRTGRVRPFTVSHYDNETGQISITVKALGKTSTLLQSIQPEQIVYIDGPYGIFSHSALQSNRPIIMIAGGIGITPFTRLFDALSHEPDRQVHLFYANRSKHEIIYKEELENADNVNTINVLSDEPDKNTETGYVNSDLIKKYTGCLDKYEFLICGPPSMTAKLENDLIQHGVEPAQIHHELFDY